MSRQQAPPPQAAAESAPDSRAGRAAQEAEAWDGLVQWIGDKRLPRDELSSVVGKKQQEKTARDEAAAEAERARVAAEEEKARLAEEERKRQEAEKEKERVRQEEERARKAAEEERVVA